MRDSYARSAGWASSSFRRREEEFRFPWANQKQTSFSKQSSITFESSTCSKSSANSVGYFCVSIRSRVEALRWIPSSMQTLRRILGRSFIAKPMPGLIMTSNASICCKRSDSSTPLVGLRGSMTCSRKSSGAWDSPQKSPSESRWTSRMLSFWIGIQNERLILRQNPYWTRSRPIRLSGLNFRRQARLWFREWSKLPRKRKGFSSSLKPFLF